MSGDTTPAVKLRLLGFYRNPKDLNTWLPSGDAGQLTDCDPSDVIVGADKQECVQALERRYPAADARMSRVLLHENGRHRHYYRHDQRRYQHENYHESDEIRVAAADRQFYTGGELETAKGLARKFGEVEIVGGKIEANDSMVKELREAGFMSEPDSRTWSRHLTGLRYNPKGMARALKSANARKKTRAVLARDIGDCAWAIFREVRANLPVQHDSGGGPYSRYSVCCSLMHSIKWFNFCFGKNAHRRHPKFHALKAEWKMRAKSSRKAYMAAAPHWGKGTQDPELFCNLMADEITKRNAPVFKGKHWVPVKEAEDFSEYKRTKFAKRLRTIESADKAKEKADAKRRKSKGVTSRKSRRTAKRKAPHGELPQVLRDV